MLDSIRARFERRRSGDVENARDTKRIVGSRSLLDPNLSENDFLREAAVYQEQCNEVANGIRRIASLATEQHIKHVEKQRDELLAALESARQWHQGDKWRNDPDEANHDAWQAQMNVIDAAIASAKGA